VTILQGDDEAKILSTLEMVKSIRHDRLAPCFKHLIHHPSAAIRLEVLNKIYYYPKVNFTDEARALVFDKTPFDPDQDVKTEAIHYLFQHSDSDRIQMLQALLEDPDYTVRGAALLCASRESRRNQKLKQSLRIQSITVNLLHQIPDLRDPQQVFFTKINCARVIGAANIPSLYPYLYIFLNDPDTAIIEVAIVAAGESRQEMFVPLIVERMPHPELQTGCGNALKLFGPEAIPILADYLHNPIADRNIRRHIPLAMALMATQAAVDTLIDNLNQKDPLVRFEIIRALNRIKRGGVEVTFNEQKIAHGILDEAKRYTNILTALYHQIRSQPGDNLSPHRRALSVAIEKRLDRNLERIFRLLGLKYPAENIYEVYRGLQSNQPEVRINAVEFLDNVLETDLKRTIIPIIETPLIDTVIDQIIERMGLKIPPELDAFALMLPEADPELQVQALELIALFNDRRYVSLVGELANDSDLRVRQTALGVLKRLGYLSGSS
jgi:AAA family ATP:ADP antiporter